MANRDNHAAGFGMKWKGRYQHEVVHPAYQPSLGILVGTKPHLSFHAISWSLSSDWGETRSLPWALSQAALCVARGSGGDTVSVRGAGLLWACASARAARRSIAPCVKNSYQEHPYGHHFRYRSMDLENVLLIYEAASTGANRNLTTMKNILTGS